MKGPSDPKLRTAFAAVFFIAVVSLLIVAAALSHSLSQFKNDITWVKHTYAVLEKLNGLSAQAEKAVSLNRAYLLSGNETLIARRDQTVATIAAAMKDLKETVADSPDRLRQLNDLEKMIHDKNADGLMLADVRAKQGLNAVAAIMTSRKSPGLMDNVRNQIGEIDKTERDLLASRIQHSQLSAARTQAFILIATAFSISLLFAAYLIIRRDLTANELAHMEVRQSKLFAEGIVETVREPILVLDRNMSVLGANRSFHLVFQTSPEEITGKKIDRLGDGVLNISSLLKLLERSFEKSDEFRGFELVHDFPSMGRRIFLLNGRKIYRADGNADTVLLAFDDVTEQRQREDEIRSLNEDLSARATALERSNAELETFNYSVSHDLRSPLRSISGFAEIIARRHRESLDTEASHYFNNIVAAGERMGRLIDDLLAYSRLGKASVRSKPVDLNRVLRLLEAEFEGRIASAGGSLEISRELPVVTGDETFIQQIFANLIDNALNYQKPGQKPHIRITSRTEENWAFIDVADNGIGIAPEHSDRIFQIFQRLHNDEQFPGTGLGLAIVKKTVILMGGEVALHSIIGAGSTFTIKLPLSPIPDPQSVAA